MNHDDLSYSVCGNVAVTWNDFTCLCPQGSVWSLTWHGGFCVAWIGDGFAGVPK